jgi:glycosyltransferase involved in cell wall biosynthesis/uncharacterized protein (DUF2062 family)
MREAAVTHEPTDVRLLVVAPTYNNADTLMAVLRAIEAVHLPVLVVNDGSDDATCPLLANWIAGAGGRFLVTHEKNCGKAAALRSGFAEARRLGFTHAATIDTDGQHDPQDLLAVRELAEAHPQAIVVGVRSIETANYPIKSLVGRRVSNLLVWMLGGVRVSDSQCGLRIYPLAVLESLRARAGRYAFETEVLIRAGWANAEVVQSPIRCIYFDGLARVSHFKPWRDSLSASWMHMKLIARTLLPWPAEKVRPIGPSSGTGTIVERMLRWINPLPTLRAARRDGKARETFARSLGTGLFFAFLPPMGFKTVGCLAVAKAFGLQPTIVLAGSSLQTPPVGIVLGIISLNVGHLLLTGSLLGPGEIDLQTHGVTGLVGKALLYWTVGGICSGAIIALTTYLCARDRSGRDTTAAAAMSATPSPSDTL